MSRYERFRGKFMSLGSVACLSKNFAAKQTLTMEQKIRSSESIVKHIGYRGLASHGGTIGLFVALAFYWRKENLKPMMVLDNVAIAAPATACCIRLGNLMNSEIIGKTTDVPWALVPHSLYVKLSKKATKSTLKKRFPIKKFGRFNKMHYLCTHENPPSLFTMLKSAGRFISKATKSPLKKQFPIKKFGRFNKKHYLCTH